MNNQSFSANKNLLIGGIVVVIVIAGVGFFVSRKPQQENSTAPTTQAHNTGEGETVSGYTGKVLAGASSPYIIFNKTDYKKALADNKIVFLDFFANWCPICRAEAPELKAGFDNLTTDKVIGFRVNFNDSDTDNEEKALAKQFEIPYQHTKVILKDGKVVLKNGDSWDKSRFEQEIGKLTQ